MTVSVFNPLQGRTPLARVFWFYGVIPSNAFWAVIFYLLWARAEPTITSVALLLVLLYTVWIVWAVWRCADNVHQERYGVMARWLTVAWAINTVLLVGFLQLELIA